jgi:hypothetical protein
MSDFSDGFYVSADAPGRPAAVWHPLDVVRRAGIEDAGPLGTRTSTYIVRPNPTPALTICKSAARHNAPIWLRIEVDGEETLIVGGSQGCAVTVDLAARPSTGQDIWSISFHYHPSMAVEWGDAHAECNAASTPDTLRPVHEIDLDLREAIKQDNPKRIDALLDERSARTARASENATSSPSQADE